LIGAFAYAGQLLELAHEVSTNAENKIATIIKEILRIFLNFLTKVKF
jgi:hypothetical protein